VNKLRPRVRSLFTRSVVGRGVGSVERMSPDGRASDIDASEIEVLRPHAEVQYAGELAALAAVDDRARPPGWNLSPWAVVTYLMGGTIAAGDGSKVVISPKYVGQRRLIEIAVATLATDRALLLLGVPGTAKTWVSEHLAAAISGDSTLLVQGTAGTTEETLRYGWNYARLLTEGPSPEALVPGPVYRAMQRGAIARVEELTRMPAEVQDALVTVLSEKVLPIPELDTEIAAVRGFNLIATANDRDRGVNELSSALRRRFNTVVLPLPATIDEEIAIVSRRVSELGAALDLPPVPAAADEISRVVTIFRELRSGVTLDQRVSLKVPTATLSTAEAISVLTNGLALAAHFGDGELGAHDVAAGIVGAVVSDPVRDTLAWREYLETVVRDRAGWGDFYDACQALDE
jgi:MoxR-like ATPase